MKRYLTTFQTTSKHRSFNLVPQSWFNHHVLVRCHAGLCMGDGAGDGVDDRAEDRSIQGSHIQSASIRLVISMPWFDTNDGSKDKENWRQLNPRVVVCAPREDLPFWKARLESLEIKRVDLHYTHRDAWNEIQDYHDSPAALDYLKPPVSEGWDIIMLFDNKIERAPDVPEQTWLGDGGCLSSFHFSVTEIGDWSSKKVTYKSPDQKLVDLLIHGFNDTGCCWMLQHVYKPNRRAKKAAKKRLYEERAAAKIAAAERAAEDAAAFEAEQSKLKTLDQFLSEKTDSLKLSSGAKRQPNEGADNDQWSNATFLVKEQPESENGRKKKLRQKKHKEVLTIDIEPELLPSITGGNKDNNRENWLFQVQAPRQRPWQRQVRQQAQAH